MDKRLLKSPIKLLWSGGWDSTFRLLQIVLDEGKAVQPYYFIAPHQRKSIANEQKAQRAIKQALFSRFPAAKRLVLPTIHIDTADILPDETITLAHAKANQAQPIGRQYEFMARYCEQQQLQGLELCLHKLGDPNVPIRFIQFLERVGDSRIFTYNLVLKDKPEYVFLKYFSYPLMDFTKEDMKRIAEEKGWMPILMKTWFCYTPIMGKFPCGVCQPCLFTIGEGFDWRIPLVTRYLHKIWDTVPIRFVRKVLRKARHKPTL